MEIGVQFYTLREHCKNLDDFAFGSCESFKEDDSCKHDAVGSDYVQQ